jgi:outer membrane receptor protein involved in Fe transport
VKSDLFGTHGGSGYAAYLQDEAAILAGMKLTAGVRFDYQKIAGLSGNSQLNPKLGMIYTIDPSITFRASAGRGFRAPSIGELYVAAMVSSSPIAIVPSTDLKPEHSWTYEAGISYALTSTTLFDAALFQSDFNDLIEAGVEIDSSSGNRRSVIRFRNITRARIQGFEAGLQSSSPDDGIAGSVSYMYNWPYDVNLRTVLKFRPRHILHISGEWEYDILTFSANFRYISRYDRVDENLALTIPDGNERVPISVTDIGVVASLAGYDLPLRISLQAKNFFRYNYVEVMGNMAPGRNFILTIEGLL